MSQLIEKQLKLATIPVLLQFKPELYEKIKFGELGHLMW